MEREKFEAIIKEINKAKCDSVHSVEDECPIFAECGYKCVAEGLDVDKHRWYETSINVYAVGEWLLGICGPSDLFSESSSYSDLFAETTAFEMEAVQSVTYQALKEQ